MAGITVLLFDLNGEAVDYGSLLSYEFNREDGVPCDSLLLQISEDTPLPEIKAVQAYYEDTMVFNGTCDLQRESIDTNGRHTLLYARSSAALLTDNEALPRTYTNPTAHTLFLLNAHGFGFQSALPQLHCEADYMVMKGSSCFQAIDSFVFVLTNRHIAVSPDNQLYIPQGEHCLCLPETVLLSECKITDRGSALSSIDYKAKGDKGYAHHIVSRYMESRGIRRSKAVSLSTLPYWQQNAALAGQLKTAANRYQQLEIKLSGCHFPSLFDTVSYRSEYALPLEKYRITAITVSGSGNSETTVIRLSGQTDLKEITYVA